MYVLYKSGSILPSLTLTLDRSVYLWSLFLLQPQKRFFF